MQGIPPIFLGGRLFFGCAAAAGFYLVAFMENFEAVLGYTFRNRLLLTEALTHPSVVYESQKAQPDYQRLEFLGDAVLNLVIAQRLYDRFAGEEGLLTKLRARLVSRPALAGYAADLQLGGFMQLGKCEERGGGRARPSNLANCFEAVLGAIYLDGGLEAARSFILKRTEKYFQELAASPCDNNPKGQLQEVLQRIKPVSPAYEIIGITGPDHARHFRVRVRWDNHLLAEGEGNTKKEAETKAAETALLSPLLADFQSRPGLAV